MKIMKYTLSGILAVASLFTANSVAEAVTYTVKAGDTLSEIAQEQNTTVEKIMELNKLQDANFITIGQILELDEQQVAKVGEASQSANVQTPSAQAAVTYEAPAVAPTSYAGGVVLANGNTAGETGRYAAARMAELTGVPAATWEHIIARESNGNPNVANASGASGLFQTMPGWGATATVEDQIAAAQRAYNAQGLSAWGY
ncbi:peptidoglycan-binding protein [Streptococcus himalayensis]|uniref:Peptidoglycan-binding protein n=2 Tax=Streptococcus himalayensis TaxID=1888195 RepID=A0A917A3Y1_9STRE|nr:LysM peptidoglycan-binding domain-containing protein [Streptococcus himalayensis]GGE23869.1 peptidoglycan-binding protein [Streptococcus himalayensis]